MMTAGRAGSAASPVQLHRAAEAETIRRPAVPQPVTVVSQRRAPAAIRPRAQRAAATTKAHASRETRMTHAARMGKAAPHVRRQTPAEAEGPRRSAAAAPRRGGAQATQTALLLSVATQRAGRAPRAPLLPRRTMQAATTEAPCRPYALTAGKDVFRTMYVVTT
jgi:hypothetical protein